MTPKERIEAAMNQERPDEIHVIYVGGLSPAKGLDVLLELPSSPLIKCCS